MLPVLLAKCVHDPCVMKTPVSDVTNFLHRQLMYACMQFRAYD